MRPKNPHEAVTNRAVNIYKELRHHTDEMKFILRRFYSPCLRCIAVTIPNEVMKIPYKINSLDILNNK